MASSEGAYSFYFHIEVAHYENGWTSAERATYIALCSLSARKQGTGVFKFYLEELADAIQATNFDGSVPEDSKLETALSSLEDKGVISRFSSRWLFVRPFWGYGHVPSNLNHQTSAERALTLASAPAEVAQAFWAHYGIPDPMPIPIRDRKPDQQQLKQSHEHPEDEKQAQARAGTRDSTNLAREGCLSLRDLETQLSGDFRENWNCFANMLFDCADEETCSEASMAAALNSLLRVMKREELSEESICYGLSESVRNQKTSVGYAINVARAYHKRTHGIPENNNSYLYKHM